jgi:translation initiation factor 2 alpha subunit (eIF-2alpha)
MSRRRHFKSITQVKLPDNYGNLYGVFVAICEEGRAWRKDPDIDEWVEVLHLPTI